MMPSAADFLPAYIRLFMNFARTVSPYLASGMTSRRSARRRRARNVFPVFLLLRSLRTLGTGERTALLAVLDPLRVKHAADDVVANAGKILHATAAQQHNGMFLQVVTFARNIADDLIAVREADLRDLAQGRVRFLGSRRIDARANAALLR